MDSSSAQRVIESLRKGIPPDGFVRHFTIGRTTEIDRLSGFLSDGDGSVLLLNANYGSGKTHLLRFIREEALDRNYIVSLVSLDAKSAVRFNRMDQIFGAVTRNIETPENPTCKGIRPFFDRISQLVVNQKGGHFWKELSNNWKWDYSETLESPAIFVAIRAWATGNSEAVDKVEDFLYHPWVYRSQRKPLYIELVENLRRHFRDPRPDWMFYRDEVFWFHTQGHAQSWSGLRDLDRLAQAAGYSGLIILFDEFEDVITNIRNIAHQEAAFWNLFHFYSGNYFPGKTFYAVTPEFVEKCKGLLLERGRWDFDFSRFDSLPRFEMSPLRLDDLLALSDRIALVHGEAYNWDTTPIRNGKRLHDVIQKANAIQIQDRTRHAITTVVKHLDTLFQGSQ